MFWKLQRYENDLEDYVTLQTEHKRTNRPVSLRRLPRRVFAVVTASEVLSTCVTYLRTWTAIVDQTLIRHPLYTIGRLEAGVPPLC